MILRTPAPQFGQCCISMSNARWSHRAHFSNRLAPNLTIANTRSWSILLKNSIQTRAVGSAFASRKSRASHRSPSQPRKGSMPRFRSQLVRGTLNKVPTPHTRDLLGQHGQIRVFQHNRPEAKNPLASLQTAAYHLRSAFGLSLLGSERGLMQLLFPVHSDVDELHRAQQRGDMPALATLLRALPVPALALPELAAELADERAQAERMLHDAMRAYADEQPVDQIGRRDALRILIAADPLDTDSREDLIRWHELHGEDDLAEHERKRLKEALAELGVD